MKSIKCSICAIILSAASLCSASDGLPTGYLDASSLLVRASSKVALDWKVQFPTSDDIEDIIEIDPDDDTVETKTKLNVKVRLLGAGYGSAYAAGWLESWAQFSDEWKAERFFNGTGDQVDPSEILKEREVDENIFLNMGFRGTKSANANTPWWKRTWNSWRMMGKNKGHGGILVLKNGDPAPNFSPERSNQLSAKTFLLPYLSADGETIKIGPKDVVVLVDLNKSNAQSGADYQDLVILMTFDTETDDD
jgi:hypothetical protein